MRAPKHRSMPTRRVRAALLALTLSSAGCIFTSTSAQASPCQAFPVTTTAAPSSSTTTTVSPTTTLPPSTTSSLPSCLELMQHDVESQRAEMLMVGCLVLLVLGAGLVLALWGGR